MDKFEALYNFGVRVHTQSIERFKRMEEKAGRFIRAAGMHLVVLGFIFNIELTKFFPASCFFDYVVYCVIILAVVNISWVLYKSQKAMILGDLRFPHVYDNMLQFFLDNDDTTIYYQLAKKHGEDSDYNMMHVTHPKSMHLLNASIFLKLAPLITIICLLLIGIQYFLHDNSNVSLFKPNVGSPTYIYGGVNIMLDGNGSGNQSSGQGSGQGQGSGSSNTPNLNVVVPQSITVQEGLQGPSVPKPADSGNSSQSRD